MSDAKARYNLKPIWDATFEIYKEVAKLCDRHGLKYYVTDGTLIGAIRHKGFIPWDDDFDMSMPRPDYEKFIVYAAKELPEHLKFVNWKNTPEFHLLFGKIQDNRQEVVERLERDTGLTMSNGLFIDIFPIDGYPERIVEKIWLKVLHFLLAKDMDFRFSNVPRSALKGRLSRFIGRGVAFVLPWLKTYQDFLSLFEQLLLRHPYDESAFTGRASLCLHQLNRPPLRKSAWGDGVSVEFHDGHVMVPSDYDAYLRPLYGDYMTLPPMEKRKPSHEYSYYVPWIYGPTTGRRCCDDANDK